MSSFRPACLLALFSIIPAFVQAFLYSGGPACSSPGSPCTYIAADGTLVNAFCAPDGYCADNGAICLTDDNCYNSCGDGICGGAGAPCNSQNAFTHGQEEQACDTPAYTCSVDGTDDSVGTCVQQASQRRRTVRIVDEKPRGELKCRISYESVCYLNGMATCLDLSTDFNNCGACGNSCGEVEGADVISCVEGTCQIDKCRYGWKLVDDECLRPAGFNSQAKRRRQ